MKASVKSRRPYRLGRRGEAAEETRRRIVRATFDLHAEQGIAETSMAQIAERAGVSVGTVYHHFPTYADAIAACGAFADEHVPAPTEAVFAGASSRSERVERLVRALFDYYERLPALASVRRDQHLAETLRRVAREEARQRRRLAAAALGTSARGAPVALLAALVDLDVQRALLNQGFGTRAAAETIAAVANAWLDRGDETRT